MADRDQLDYVARHEFESLSERVDDVGQRLDKGLTELGRKLDRAMEQVTHRMREESEMMRPSWKTMGVLLLSVGGPFACAVQNFTKMETLSAQFDTHVGDSEDRAALTRELRERARALEERVMEEEAQHRHLADIANLTTDYESILRAARCDACGSNSVAFPQRDFWPMASLGRAPPMAKGD